MKIQYDRKLKIGGIGVTPWGRIGPEEWFNGYRIASFYNWDITAEDAPQVLPLENLSKQTLPILSTQELLRNSEFQDLLLENFEGHNILTYKSISLEIPEALRKARLNFMGITPGAISLENKVNFRRKFQGKLPFPPFKIFRLSPAPTPSELLEGKDRIVLQHETLSGSKGTFIVRSTMECQKALDILRAKNPKREVVVSDYIEGGLERSLQCCATKYGIFVGPLQKQLVNRPELLNPRNIKRGKFCGAEIAGYGQPECLVKEMGRYCKLIGQELLANGYRGIFGVDFLLSKTGEVFVLEVNQRITGVTPLLNMLYREDRDIPFYLLHILETGKFDYKITDFDFDPKPRQGSMLIFRSKELEPALVANNVKSGLYSALDASFRTPGFRLDNEDNSILLQKHMPEGSIAKPGARLAVAYTNSRVLEQNDALKDSVSKFIGEIYTKISIARFGKA